MATWNWSHTSVTAGGTTTVTVTSAPCQPITVKLQVRGVEVASGTVQPGGSVELAVPAGSQGQAYLIRVTCNGQSDTKSGNVQ
jgi:hypothetical protein